MTTTANIQTDCNTVVQNTNITTEEGAMNHASNNINMVTRISNAFRMGSISKFAAGATLGLALTIGLAMPGSARADSPLVAVSSSSVSGLWNDDFSLVYGTPDSGLELGGASTSAAAKMKLNIDTDNWNDDFSMVYGTPDSGLELDGASTSAAAKVKLNIDTVNWNDDFSMVYGIPDNGPGRSGASANAPAKVKMNTNMDLFWNDDFSLVYGTSDIVG